MKERLLSLLNHPVITKAHKPAHLRKDRQAVKRATEATELNPIAKRYLRAYFPEINQREWCRL